MAISYDSSRAISIVKVTDKLYYIQQFDLTCRNYSLVTEDLIGGREDSYIKVKEIEQSQAGDKFSVVYIDNGKFRLRVFDKSK